MIIDCKFESGNFNCYRCVVFGQLISIPENIQFIGNHFKQKSNNDVDEIIFNGCKFKKFPKGLTKVFPKLQALDIYHCEITTITKSDLSEYKNFRRIGLVNDQIENIPGDLFEGFTNLDRVFLCDNPLKVVEPNILNGLDKLTYFSLSQRFGCFNAERDKNTENLKNKILNEFVKNDQQVIKSYIEKILIKLQDVNGRNKNSENFNTKPVNNQNSKFICNDLRKFIEDETTKDFQIQIDDHAFPVHKFLLAARSPTLAGLLKNNPEVENLNLVDISVETFERILKFLYTDELPDDDGTDFLHLFAAAGKLKIEELMNFTSRKILETINDENATEVLKIGCKYEQKELKERAFEIIKAKYPKTKFKDELIDDPEKVEKLLLFLKKMEEVEKGIEDLL